MDSRGMLGRTAHVFAPHLFLCELDPNEGLHCSEEFPPWPVLHAMVLFDVLLNAPDCQILDLQTHMHKCTGTNIIENVKNAKECYCDTTRYRPVRNVVLDIKWMYFNAVVS